MEKRSILSGVDPMTTRRWFLVVNESESCFSTEVHVSSEKSPTGAGTMVLRNAIRWFLFAGCTVSRQITGRS